MITYSIIQKSQLEGAHRLDAEYYQPEYLELIQKLKLFPGGFKTLESDAKIVSGPFGSSLKSEAYLKKGVPFLRISDLQQFFVDNTNLVYISEKDNDRLRQSQLLPHDLVISKVGNTIGIISAIPDNFKVCNISENNIGIKFKDSKITDEQKVFLLTFLNSKFGFKQIIRKISGNAQPKLNIQDIYDLVYPITTNSFNLEIYESVSDAKKRIHQAGALYSQAENLLLEELGLKNFEEEAGLCSIVNFSDVKKSERLDAEYFQSTFEKIKSKLKDYKIEKLGNLASVQKGFEPGSEAYQEEGKLFIRVSSLSKDGITDKDQKYLNDKLYNELRDDFQPKIGEVLLTKDATPGIAYVLKEPIEGIISGGILRLSVSKEIDSEYLALCINSMIGQSQVERDAGGSIIKHWKPSQIEEMIIPILPKAKQEKISDLVRQSHEARKKAKELLEQAKQKVEKLIENKN